MKIILNVNIKDLSLENQVYDTNTAPMGGELLVKLQLEPEINLGNDFSIYNF